MASIGVAWSRTAPTDWPHGWPDVAIDRPAQLVRYWDGEHGLGPFAEEAARGRAPAIHWGTVLRLGGAVYALGRYFPIQDRRCPGHDLSSLVLAAKDTQKARCEMARIFRALAADMPVRARPELICSVPAAPEEPDRFGLVRAALAEGYGADDGGGVLRMRYAVDDYKKASRADRAGLNEGRFAAKRLSGERVMLIDDVITSGSQSLACRAALGAAGSGPVTVVSLTVTQDKLPEQCPRCERNLVVRTRHSDGVRFIGCSNFPACRYTRPL